jgi:hypothetical protein
MLSRGVPTGSSPKIVACVITVVVDRKKSSAVSVSTFPGLGRRESAASRPLGLPVAKKNEDANKGVVRHTINVNATPIKVAFDIPVLLIIVITFLPFGFGTLAFDSRIEHGGFSGQTVRNVRSDVLGAVFVAF